mmetsp:Transcript_70631/g.216456  ORF Transcript_70631/g.216456 Transcript_70631/m.216456 type:complete len:202 (-) Transcript_70631:27-632(-)
MRIGYLKGRRPRKPRGPHRRPQPWTPPEASPGGTGQHGCKRNVILTPPDSTSRGVRISTFGMGSTRTTDSIPRTASSPGRSAIRRRIAGGPRPTCLAPSRATSAYFSRAVVVMLEAGAHITTICQLKKSATSLTSCMMYSGVSVSLATAMTSVVSVASIPRAKPCLLATCASTVQRRMLSNRSTGCSRKSLANGVAWSTCA